MNVSEKVGYCCTSWAKTHLKPFKITTCRMDCKTSHKICRRRCVSIVSQLLREVSFEMSDLHAIIDSVLLLPPSYSSHTGVSASTEMTHCCAWGFGARGGQGWVRDPTPRPGLVGPAGRPGRQGGGAVRGTGRAGREGGLPAASQG